MIVNTRQAGFLLFAMLVLSLPAAADNRLPVPNWDRELAMETAAMGFDGQQLNTWFGMLRSGRRTELLHAIEAFGASHQVSAPAREKQLFLFTQGLADFPEPAIPSELLKFLARYSPQTLVPHTEDVSLAVPLFNVPAAALGVMHGIERQHGELWSVRQLALAPETWIQGYLAASTQSRAGFLEGLEGASDHQLERLEQASLKAFRKHPELFVVAATTALRSADLQTLERLVIESRSPYLAPVLRSAAGTLADSELARLLLAAIESAPAENAALAIGLLAPSLRAIPEVTQSLFDLLDDAQLGSAAALALAAHPDPGVRQMLGRLAGEEGTAALRARLALDSPVGPPRP